MAEIETPPPPHQPEAVPSVTAATILQVHEWLALGEIAKVQRLATDLLPIDLAGLLELSKNDDRQILIGLLQQQITPEVISCLEPEIREDVLERLRPQDIAAAVAELESDDAVDIVEDLDEEDRQAVLESMSAEDREEVEEALSYPEESAGRLMQREVVAVPEDWTVGKTVDFFHEKADELPPDFYDVIVTNPWHQVVGTIALSHILREGRAIKLRDIVNEDVRHIPVLMDREEVAYLFKRYRLLSAPVVDEEDRLLGVITVDDIVEVMEEEASEDLLSMHGVDGEESIHDDVREVTKSRFMWLFLNLITAILAALTISLFEASLEKVVALAVLMPIVASMGGNAGTQTLTVAVRALATKDLGPSNYWRLVNREVMIGAINGSGFAIIMGLIAYLWFNDPLIGLVIAAAMIINLVAAGFSGALIPIIMRTYGFDPAVSSVVFLTTVTDIVGFAAFLGLATLVLF